MKRNCICWLAFLPLFGTLAAGAQSGAASRTDYRLIAHRGGIVDSLSAENSLPALERAIAAGYWMVEVDLRLMEDSVLITQHDRNFRRYFGVDSAVDAMSWLSIQIDSAFDRFYIKTQKRYT